VFRYGTTGTECYFILKGRVAMLQPEKVTIDVKTEQEMIQFYAEHFNSVIWEKVDDGEEIKEMARLYLNDPENLDFTVLKVEIDKEDTSHRYPNIDIEIASPYANTMKRVEIMSRPGSSKSLKSMKSN